MMYNYSTTTTMAVVVVVLASLSATSASASAAAAEEDEALASLLRSNPRAAAMAEAAAAADAVEDAGSGPLAVWERDPAQTDPRWYLITETDALQESGLPPRRRDRQSSTTTSSWAHRVTPPSFSMDYNSDDERHSRGAEHKRGGGPSLSIVNPLEVLRQRVLLELARRRYKQSEGQIQANRNMLRVIGKRGRWQ